MGIMEFKALNFHQASTRHPPIFFQASSSEFARTLDSNGGGSDHAWAGQHFIIGGKAAGPQVMVSSG